MNPKPGEVWLVDLGLAAKTRPAVIVSRYDPLRHALWFFTYQLRHKIEEAHTRLNCLSYRFCDKVLLLMCKV